MKDYDLGEFKISKKIQKKLNDKEWLKKEFAKGRSAQDIMGFSDETMAKFYGAAYQLFEGEKYTDAADAFLFLVTLNPKNSEFWLGLGMSMQMCGKYEDAIDAYEMAAFYKLDNPIPYFYLAKCLFAMHDRDNALQALDLAVEYSSGQMEYEDLRRQAIQARNLLMGHE
jgi:type III secretion system low calcium response chaperone LcrH/SycD